jgi:transposase
VEIFNLHSFMAKKLLKQVVGIDVAQKKIDVSLGRMDETGNTEVYVYRKFANDQKGFAAFILWVKKHTEPQELIRFVMEATGVYHEHLAYFLFGNGYAVSIIMPNKMSNFFKTREVKTITDKTMSETIAMFGLEKVLTDWVPAKKVYRELRQITREREQLVDERTMVKNQLHAEQVQAYPNATTLARVMDRIRLLNKQIKQIMDEIKERVQDDKELSATMKLVTTIPGVALLTATIVLSETDGFSLITNKRQLASYAGFDVIEKESGTSIKAKPRISKKGNRHLRKAMHMPALSAIGCAKIYKDVFVRIVSRTGIKMKGAVAVQRKLLEMIYTIYSTKKPFEIDYLKQEAQRKKEQAETEKSG